MTKHYHLKLTLHRHLLKQAMNHPFTHCLHRRQILFPSHTVSQQSLWYFNDVLALHPQTPNSGATYHWKYALEHQRGRQSRDE